MSCKKECPAFRTSIGGQALIEGIMMRGPETIATAVRKPDGEIELKTEPIRHIFKHKFFRLPLIRGVFNFFESMILGTKELMYSAEFYDLEEESEPGWLERKLGDKLQSVVITFSVILGIGLSVLLFMFLPRLLVDLLNWIFGDLNVFLQSVLEGVFRITIFVTYLLLVTRMKDIRRVFEYHGAEHKTIFCYENRLPLTVENVRGQSRLHPRCGTSFLCIVMIVSILIFTVLNALLGEATPAWQALLYRLLLLPVVAGVSYEFIKWAGRSDGAVSRILSKPGLWLQNITTVEPDDSQIEVAIAAMTAVLPAEEKDAQW
ncbi:MAG: DUF1385 domain-containing protein [Clostridia bacterium]|nr:DUF1385 domain-containing protein [Clostridia bacterium]